MNSTPKKELISEIGDSKVNKELDEKTKHLTFTKDCRSYHLCVQKTIILLRKYQRSEPRGYRQGISMKEVYYT